MIPDTQSLLLRLKSRQLLLLLALDGHRSLRQAAAALRTTQPAATKLLQDLEEAVGVPLFERHRRGIRPNAFGAVMIQHARLMLADLDHARIELEVLASGGSGRLRIGGVSSAIPFLIARAVIRLKETRPRLVVSIDVNTSDILAPALARNELDVLVARPVILGGEHEFDYEPLVDEPLTVVCRVGHPLLSAGGLALSDLSEWTWTLLPANSPMRQVLAPIFAEITRHNPIDVVETSSMLTMSALLQESEMLSVLPEHVARYHIERGLLARVPVALPPVIGSYGIVTRRDRPRSSNVAAFIAELKRIVAEQGPASDIQD